MDYVLHRTEKILELIKENISVNEIRIENIGYSKGKKYPEQWSIFPKGMLWGGYDIWCWFRCEITVPDLFDGNNLWIKVETGREESYDLLNPQMLLYVDEIARQAVDTNHYEYCLSDCAVGGRKFVLEFQAYSGTARPDQQNSVSIIKKLDERLEFKVYLFSKNKNIEKLYYDLLAPLKVASLYLEDNLYRYQIATYLNQAVTMLDTRKVPGVDFETSVVLADEYLRNHFYKEYCGKTEATAKCIGHTHIDVAWLWTIDQTKEKAIRSFSTVLKLMEEYPDYQFMQGQPQLYQYVKVNAPEVYERIREKVKEKRWLPDGGMWVEADCNLISGESLIRQLIHGKRFFREEFSTDSRLCWLPDVFGYSAAMPQILKKCGIDYFVTSKISWNDTNHIPYDSFQWVGIDGSEIFTQFINASLIGGDIQDHQNFFSTYNAQMLPDCLQGGWRNYQHKAKNQETLVPFGFGDGGGGPTREDLEMYERLHFGIPGCPKAEIQNPYETVKNIEQTLKDNKGLKKWIGELYLENHRGTYTSMARNKRYNRKCEFLLTGIEILGVLNHLMIGEDYDQRRVNSRWEILLLNQFHDIIPGSSIEEVYIDSKEQYEKLISELHATKLEKLRQLALRINKEGIFVYNSSALTQSGIVKFGGKEYWASEIPAHGWKVLQKEQEAQMCQIFISKESMENRFYRMEFEEDMTICRIYDKQYDREVLLPGRRGNVLLAFEDRPVNFDAWNLDYSYMEKSWEISDVEEVYIHENIENSGAITVVRRFGDSKIQQTIRIYEMVARIDFETLIDWKEDHIFLKTEFPVNVHAEKATYEIQYGYLERPTHRNTSWDEAKFEVCGHKWADLSDAGYGVSILNDCKYGYDIHDSNIRLSLLKSATDPNPVADKECHQFVYSLFPHSGSFREAGTIREAYALNCPLEAVECEGGGMLPEIFAPIMISKENIVCEVMKKAYDDHGNVFRFYEAYGMQTKALIRFAFPIVRAIMCDMLENEQYEIPVKENGIIVSFHNFEIHTIKIIQMESN